MIVGIALVVDELRKGQRLVFRYPEAVPSFILNNSEALLRFHNEYLSLTAEQFAKLFRPKASLFNKVMDIIIGDLQYFSFPTSCAEELSDIGETETNVISMFNVVIAVVRESSLKRVMGAEFIWDRKLMSGIDPVSGILGLQNRIRHIDEKIIYNVIEKFSQALLIQERKHRYVSSEVLLMLQILESSKYAPMINTESYISMPENEPIISYPFNDRLDHNVQPNLSAAATSLPGLESAVSDGLIESGGKVSDSHPSYDENDQSVSSYSRQSSFNSDLPLKDSPMPQTLTDTTFNLILSKREEMLQYSNLANELRVVYHGLMGEASVSLTINGEVAIDIDLEQKSDDVPLVDSIRPYHTLLTIGDPEVIRSIIGSDDDLSTDNEDNFSNHSMVNIGANDNHYVPKEVYSHERVMNTTFYLKSSQFEFSNVLSPIEFALASDPTCSLAELTSRYDIRFKEVQEMVKIICAKGLGEVISTVNKNSVYIRHPAINRDKSHRVRKAFNSKFMPVSSTYNAPLNKSNQIEIKGKQDRSLGNRRNCCKQEKRLFQKVLKLFDGNLDLVAVAEKFPKSLQSHAIDIVIWLLRWHMLSEVQSFLLDTSKFRAQSDHCHDRRDEITIKSSSTRGLASKDSHLMKRISKYLDGKTSLLEIIYLEGIQEKDIQNLLRKNKHIILIKKPLIHI